MTVPPRSGLDATPEQIELALRAGRYDEVLALADAAILEMLQPGLSVEEFVRLSLRGAALESLVRFERTALMRFRHLHEPIALRWEALRRSGRTLEARQMRLLCTRQFPERASVWASAGNQALDEQDYDQAEACFARCLRCDPEWTAGLAGLAIVLECRKDWARALTYRRRVVEVEGSLERSDAPSLQRAMRYAAALCRVERWEEAGVILRRCVERGAYEALPAERPVLLRVYSRELYAPSLVAALCARDPDAARTPEIELAVSEAAQLARLAEAALVQPALDAGARLLWLGLCAWLAGDDARAYAWLDEAEVDAPGDPAIQCFLAWSAQSLAAPDQQQIVQFALEQAHGALRAGERATDADLACAAVSFARAGDRSSALQALAQGLEAQGSLCALCSAAFAGEDTPPADAPTESLAARLLRLAVYRAAQRAAGRPAWQVARASAAALRALTSSL